MVTILGVDFGMLKSLNLSAIFNGIKNDVMVTKLKTCLYFVLALCSGG